MTFVSDVLDKHSLRFRDELFDTRPESLTISLIASSASASPILAAAQANVGVRASRIASSSWRQQCLQQSELQRNLSVQN